MKLGSGIVLFVMGSAFSLAHAASPDPYGAEQARADIKATLGFVPGFFNVFPDEGIAGAWDEFKSVQLNPKTAVPSKYKELIALGVASQIPCEYCIYFHTKAATANGATERELKEAVAISAVVRHWSTLLNGALLDEGQFKKDLDQVVQNALAAAKSPSKAQPAAATPTNAAEARADIASTLGFVPAMFGVVPEQGLAGAWRELKTLQLNPDTAIPGKYKEMIALGVAAQIPCRYCTVFHRTVASKLGGASEAELQEAVAMSALVRHWSTVLNGNQIDKATFRREVDRALGGGKSATN